MYILNSGTSPSYYLLKPSLTHLFRTSPKQLKSHFSNLVAKFFTVVIQDLGVFIGWNLRICAMCITLFTILQGEAPCKIMHPHTLFRGCIISGYTGAYTGSMGDGLCSPKHCLLPFRPLCSIFLVEKGGNIQAFRKCFISEI